MTNDYPTEEDLDRIRKWTDTPHELMAFVKSIWWMEYGWYETDDDGDRIYGMSTGGWSGNEEIVDALDDGMSGTFWRNYWHSTRRGGHYEFCIPGAP